MSHGTREHCAAVSTPNTAPCWANREHAALLTIVSSETFTSVSLFAEVAEEMESLAPQYSFSMGIVSNGSPVGGTILCLSLTEVDGVLVLLILLCFAVDIVVLRLFDAYCNAVDSHCNVIHDRCILLIH